LFSSLVVTDVPAIINKLEDPQQVYAWEVQVPAKVTYRSTTSAATEELMFHIMIQRVSQLQNPMGVGIASVIMAENPR
jgi:hypothetical protein